MDYGKLFSLCKSDWVKGLIVAIITVPLGIIVDNAQKVLTNPAAPFAINWRLMVAAAIVGAGAYIIKNFLTGSGGKILTNDPPKLS